MIRVIVTAAGLLFPILMLFGQDSAILRADRLYNEKRYKEAEHLYRQVLNEHADILRSEAGQFRYYHLRYRMAQLNQKPGSRDSLYLYKRLIRELTDNTEHFYHWKRDDRLLLYLAESMMATDQFEWATEIYQIATEKLDSIPDYAKFGNAVSAMRAGYYGFARKKFVLIKKAHLFEPEYSSYLKKCKDSSRCHLLDDMAWGDTLTIHIETRGCWSNRYDYYSFIKRPFGYQVISYEEDDRSYKTAKKEMIVKGSVLSEFEKAIRDFCYDFGITSTMDVQYSIKTKSGQFKLSVIGQFVPHHWDFREAMERLRF